jgi:hypothetical protein
MEARTMHKLSLAIVVALAVIVAPLGLAGAGEPLAVGTKAERKAALKKFDTNKDGALQQAELAKIQQTNPAMYRALGKLAVRQGITGDDGGTWHIRVGDELPSGVVQLWQDFPDVGSKAVEKVE